MVVASAPAKVILLGEHGVVYGEPALAAAVDLRAEVEMVPAEGNGTTVNGHPLSAHHHAHVKLAIDHLWTGGALAVETRSRIPSTAGLGSSAALSAASVAALLELQGKFDARAVASLAYDVEWAAQGGRGSPTDTATVTHGRGILVDSQPGEGLLWEAARGERKWFLHHMDLPPFTLVIGNTQERGRTTEEVAKVARLVRRSGFALETLREIGDVTREGIEAIRKADPAALGKCFDRAHNLLTILGVSTPRLNRLVEAARAHAYGAKLTGSGGGGSMVALTDAPEACAGAIRRKGGEAYVVQFTPRGVEVGS